MRTVRIRKVTTKTTKHIRGLIYRSTLVMPKPVNFSVVKTSLREWLLEFTFQGIKRLGNSLLIRVVTMIPSGNGLVNTFC